MLFIASGDIDPAQKRLKKSTKWINGINHGRNP
jgi:hypothetical protein